MIAGYERGPLSTSAGDRQPQDMDGAGQGTGRRPQPPPPLFTRLRLVWRRAPLQLLIIIYSLIELIMSSVVLAISWNTEHCAPQPIKPWIILYSSRLIVRIPLLVSLVDFAVFRQSQPPNWIKVASNISQYYTIFAWILGNIWFYAKSLSPCRTTAPISYYYAIALIAIVYVYIFIPLLICIVICLCFPVAMFIMHVCGVGQKRASERMIARLKHSRYQGPPSANESNSSVTTQCAICMNDFVIGNEITTLPCGHSFDKDCIETWLRVKRFCALCRHDITVPAQLQP